MKNKQSELIAQLTGKQLRLHVWLTQAILLLICMILSFLFFTSFQEIYMLFNWNLYDILLLGMLPAGFIILFDVVIMQYAPKRLWDDGGINEKIFKDGSYIEIFFLCLTISIVEEWLFRGVLQSNWGIIIASIIFALVHIRYLSKPLLFLSIIILSFVFGIIFEWSDHNLIVVIVLHFIVDFVLALYIRIGRSRHVQRSSSTS